MKPKARNQLVNVHVVLATFFLPIAVMFLVTGGLYTIAIKGSYKSTTHPVVLKEPLPSELGALVSMAEGELARLGIEPPTGGAGLRKAGTSQELEWTGANRDVSLRPTADPLVAELVVKDTTAYRRLVQLHKAKGSAVGKAISVAWAVALMAMLVSGASIAWGSPKHRRLAMISSASGVLLFVAYVAIG